MAVATDTTAAPHAVRQGEEAATQQQQQAPHTQPPRAVTRQQLQVLDHLQHPVWVFDVERLRIWWGNTASLQSIWDAPDLATLQARDFSIDLTAVTKRRLEEKLRLVKQGQVIREQWTLYPNGQAKTLLVVLSGITMLEDDNDGDGGGGRVAVMIEAELPDCRDFEDDTVRQVELLRHVPVAVCQFTMDGQQATYRNPEDVKLFGESPTPLSSTTTSSSSKAPSKLTSVALADRFVDPEMAVRAFAATKEQGKEFNMEVEQFLAPAGESSDQNDNNNNNNNNKNHHQPEEEEGFATQLANRSSSSSSSSSSNKDGCLSSSSSSSSNQNQKQQSRRRAWFSVSLHKGTDPVSGDAVLNYCARDITEIVQARNATLKAKSKTEFLSVIAHELRTPLHQVIGYADLLEQSTQLTPSQKATVQEIQKSSELLITIINDLLDYSKIEGGKATIQSVQFRLQSLVQGCLDAVQTEAAAKGLLLESAFVEDSDSHNTDDNNDMSLSTTDLIGDIDKVRQILLNLAENAVKYTSTGKIMLRVSRVKGGTSATTTSTTSTITANWGVKEDNGIQDKEQSEEEQQQQHDRPKRRRVWIRFEVQDTGWGIPSEQQKAIFQKYHQIDGSSTRKVDGIGLGLAICQGLTKLLGGKLNLQSTVGQGSTFSFEIPFGLPPSKRISNDATSSTATTVTAALLSSSAAAQAEAALNYSPANSTDTDTHQPLRVLVVEDNETNRKMVQRMLQKIGHTVILAENGQIAVDILEKHKTLPADLVLMDIQMPVLDGIEASKYIRKHLKISRQDLPIVGLTASFQHSDLNFYLDAGMNACLGKPVRLGMLRQTLTSVVARCVLGLYDNENDS